MVPIVWTFGAGLVPSQWLACRGLPPLAAGRSFKRSPAGAIPRVGQSPSSPRPRVVELSPPAVLLYRRARGQHRARVRGAAPDAADRQQPAPDARGGVRREAVRPTGTGTGTHGDGDA